MDAPEGDQWCEADGRRWSCGDASTTVLVELIGGHEVECRAPDRDRYGRPLAICWAGGIELNREMVRLGWALVYRPGDDPFPRPEYEAEEAEAREAGRGLWQGDFVAPWEWRGSTP